MSKIKETGYESFLRIIDDIERTIKDNISSHKIHLNHIQRLRMEWKRKAMEKKNTVRALAEKGVKAVK